MTYKEKELLFRLFYKLERNFNLNRWQREFIRSIRIREITSFTDNQKTKILEAVNTAYEYKNRKALEILVLRNDVNFK